MLHVMLQSETKQSHAWGQQSNLWWISSNWKIPSCFSPIVKRNNSHQQEGGNNVQCHHRRETRIRHVQFSKIWGLKQKIRTVVTINREFLNCLLDPRCRIRLESETNKDNLLCEWKAQETWRSTDASGTRHFYSVWCCICLIWQKLVIRLYKCIRKNTFWHKNTETRKCLIGFYSVWIGHMLLVSDSEGLDLKLLLSETFLKLNPLGRCLSVD